MSQTYKSSLKFTSKSHQTTSLPSLTNTNINTSKHSPYQPYSQHLLLYYFTTHPFHIYHHDLPFDFPCLGFCFYLPFVHQRSPCTGLVHFLSSSSFSLLTYIHSQFVVMFLASVLSWRDSRLSALYSHLSSTLLVWAQTTPKRSQWSLLTLILTKHSSFKRFKKP